MKRASFSGTTGSTVEHDGMRTVQQRKTYPIGTLLELKSMALSRIISKWQCHSVFFSTLLRNWDYDYVEYR